MVPIKVSFTKPPLQIAPCHPFVPSGLRFGKSASDLFVFLAIAAKTGRMLQLNVLQMVNLASYKHLNKWDEYWL